MHRLPDLLSGFRLAMVPVLGGLAFCGAPALFLAGLVAALASDVADGFLARRLDCASERGARLDSLADLLTFATLPLFAWWLWPDLLRTESAWVAAGILAFALPTFVGWLRFGRLTSYHTWLAKLSSWLVGGSALLLFAGGPAWPFHVAVVVLALEAAEELAITALLPRWRADVPTLWHALQPDAGVA